MYRDPKEALKESACDNEVECILQRKLVKEIADVFLPVYPSTHGEHGYVSIQGDPIHEEDPAVIIQEGRLNREMGPNVMIKIPATKAGLDAMDVLIAENTPINATEVMVRPMIWAWSLSSDISILDNPLVSQGMKPPSAPPTKPRAGSWKAAGATCWWKSTMKPIPPTSLPS